MPEQPSSIRIEVQPRLADRVIGLVEQCASRLRMLRGVTRLLAAAAAGALSTLAMAPTYAAPILALTLPALVWLLEGGLEAARGAPRPRRRAALTGFSVGWAFGFGYHVVGLYWIGEAFLVEADVFAWLLPFAVTLLPAAMAIYWGVATAMATLVWQRFREGRGPLWQVGVLALAMALAEWLRGHLFTGFPWNVLGYALTGPILLMQGAGLIGIYGLTIATILAFATPLVVLAARAGRADRRGLAVRALAPPIVIAAGLVLYGAMRLGPTPPPVEGVRLRIVQPSIPQKQKWRHDLQRRFFEQHLDLSGRVADEPGRKSFEGITHIIWPEASMPFGPLRSPEALAMIEARLPRDVHLVAGALRLGDLAPAGSDRPQAFNSLLVFSGGAHLSALYDKIHLVPFGEYLPFQSTLERLGLEQLSRMRGGFAAGPVPRPILPIPGLPPVGVLICYEAIFPAAVVQDRTRPGVLVNITNDGWFGNSTGPRQHLHQTRVRAVEEGVPVVRAANNGISGLVDPYGRLIARLELDVVGTLDVALPKHIAPPLYARLGDAVFWVLMVAGVAMLAGSVMLRRSVAGNAL